MEPYASVDEYIAAYGLEVDKDKLQIMLEDATRRISAELETSGIDPTEKGGAYLDRLSQVCRSMVHRCVDRHESTFGAMPAGVTQFSQGAGDFSRSFTFANVYTEPKLTKDERKFLGIKTSRIVFVLPKGAQ